MTVVVTDKVRPLVRVITINFDGGDVTLRCLESLHHLRYPQDRLEIVLVDNASIDGILWTIRERFPRVKIIESLVNEGFARGNNLAMRDLAEVDYVALINNDAIAEPDWLSRLVDRAETSSRIGAVSSKMLFEKAVIGFDIEPLSGAVAVTDVLVEDVSRLQSLHFDERRTGLQPPERAGHHEFWINSRTSMWLAWSLSQSCHLQLKLYAETPVEVKVWNSVGSFQTSIPAGNSSLSLLVNSQERVINNAGGAIFPRLYGGDIGFKELDFGQYETPRQVFSFCGGAALLRTSMLKSVGLFDDSFFLYYEDLDLSWRARSSGWEVHYEPSSVVLHEHAYSSVEGSDFFRFWVDRNRRLTLLKNAPFRVAVSVFLSAILNALTDLSRGALRNIYRNRNPVPEVVYRLRQLGSFLLASPKALRFRRTWSRKSHQSRKFVYEWITTR
jgi:GT2 family glycosyltransferase